MKEDMKPSSQPVKFSVAGSSFAVKAADASFDNGDLLGVFADSPIGKINVKATVSGSDLNPETEIKWADNQTAASSFAAYYPYDALVTGKTFTFNVKTDQSSAAGYFASDLRAAVTSASPNNTVNFSLKHILSKLSVIFAVEDATESVQEVEVNGAVTDLSVDLSVPKATAGASKAAIKAGPATSANGGSGFVAILAPQTVQLSLVVKTSKGRSLDYVLEAPQILESGVAYKAELTVPKETTPAQPDAITFTVATVDWNDGNPLNFVGEGGSEGGGDINSHNGQWSVIGLSNDWNTDIWMTCTSENTWEVDIDVTPAESFKLRQDGAWSDNDAGIHHAQAGLWGNDTRDSIPVPSENDLTDEDAYANDVWVGNKVIKIDYTGKVHLKFVSEGYHLTVTASE